MKRINCIPFFVAVAIPLNIFDYLENFQKEKIHFKVEQTLG